MTPIHEDFLELAAAAIDFEPTPAERDALAAHLATCVTCRRRVTALQADGRSLSALPAYTLPAEDVARIRRRVVRGSRSISSTLRLIALAAMLALVALSALGVGAELLRRQQERDLSFVPPSTPEESALPAPPTSIPEPSPVDLGPEVSQPGDLQVGSIAEVVVTGLRVRTAPTVDDAVSAKLEPLLSNGIRLEILEGPVRADDYDWYLVQAVGLPHRGWVAASDHDGEAWIEPLSTGPSAAPGLTADESTLVDALRRDAAESCAPRRNDLPTSDMMAGVECNIDTRLVQRVGAYLFADAKDAARWYVARLAEYGITPGTGDCYSQGSEGGDAAWSPNDGVAGDGDDRILVDGTGPWAVGRIGCFRDENGTPNVRATCGRVYVGILGREGALTLLHQWTWWPTAGDTESGTPPGICRSRS
jgi:hypothetical protein